MTLLGRTITTFVLSVGSVVNAADGVDRFFANGLDNFIGSECVYKVRSKGTDVTLTYTVTNVSGNSITGEFIRVEGEKEDRYPLELLVTEDGIFNKSFPSPFNAHQNRLAKSALFVKFPLQVGESYSFETEGQGSYEWGGRRVRWSSVGEVKPLSWSKQKYESGGLVSLRLMRYERFSDGQSNGSTTQELYVADSPCFVRRWSFKSNWNHLTSFELVSEKLVESSVMRDDSLSSLDEAAAAAEEAARAAEEAARVAVEKAAAAKAAAEKAAAEVAKKVSIVFSFQDGSGATVDHQVDGSSLSPPITSCDLGLTVKDVVRIYDTLPMRYADFKVLGMRCVGN